jgi:hypothetical protein
MTYGLSFTNNQNTVILDSEFARLCVISGGRYAANQDGGLGSLTTFVRPVTSQEPPLVFIRPDTTNAIAAAGKMYLTGGPGNWTGFYVRTYGVTTAQPNGRYFVATFAAQPVANYGLRLWDGAGKLLFDSGTQAALFTRSFSNWTYVKSEQTPTTSYRNYYRVDFNFPENEYLMINSFGMTLLSGGSEGRNLFTWWDFAGGNMYAITEAFSNPYDFHLPAVFAKIAA